MTDYQCMYCLKIKRISDFTKKEHVIPQSFGVFKNNLTLDKFVCDDCNQFFGDTLEIGLARDTFEGLKRFDYGVKQPKEYKSFGEKSRLTHKVAEGPFTGALVYLEYSPIFNNIMIRPIKQIGFLKQNTGQYIYYSIDNIPDISILEEQGINNEIQKTVKVIGIDSAEAEVILKKKGIDIQSWSDVNSLEPIDGSWNVEIEGYIDLILIRAIAKIAFNYFIYKQGADISKQVEFDEIRNFVLNGNRPSYPIINILERAILYDEKEGERRRLGHLITLNWSTDRTAIVSMVSLFNQNTYLICLSRNYSGKNLNLPVGNFFDTHNHTIFPLLAN